MTGAVRLHAQDIDDLAVISALVQDAALFVGEMAYLPSQKRFVAALARFAWEELDDVVEKKRGFLSRVFNRADPEPFARTRALLHIDNVSDVKVRGFGLEEKAKVLDLLALTVTPLGDDPSGPFALQLECADNAAVRLDVEALDIYLTDKGEPWKTPVRPDHKLDD